MILSTEVGNHWIVERQHQHHVCHMTLLLDNDYCFHCQGTDENRLILQC